MQPRVKAVLLTAALLSACAGKRFSSPDNEPTLKALAGREVAIDKDAGIPASTTKAIAAYRSFLEATPRAAQRSEAMRRLGDLEMAGADDRIASGQADGTAADYKAAVTRYQEFLVAYPKDPGNDRVLYQLARAHEQGGELELALKTLDRLVAEYPDTKHANEAQFRRGEMLFSMRDYVKSEQAFATVLKTKNETKNETKNDNPYEDRALYMQGWSLFKLGRLEDALHAFFGVLDLKVADREGEEDLETVAGLTRADRELVEDTFRVMSLSLQALQGAESIPAYITSDARRSYEFRVYQQLGQLFIRQERIKDAADAYSAFARRQPLHAQAPLLQARVIDIYQDGGFASLALEAKKEYVARYGVGSEFKMSNPEGWERAQPLVKTHLAELARHYHASAQKSKGTADYQEAVRWYRAYLEAFPKDPEAAQSNFLLAELLYEDRRFNEAAAEYEKTAYQYPAHTKSADAGYAALLSYAGQQKLAPAADAPALRRVAVESALRFAAAFPADNRAGLVLTDASEKLYALGDTERAATVAEQVLKLDPPATPANRRVAWTVIAHTAFERGGFDRAERAYGEVLALTPERDAARADLIERQAAAIYKQGEQARSAGKAREAVGHFERVASVAPASAIRATAQYDAAAVLMGLKDFAAAARTLEDFRQRYPQHALQADVGGKLALAYIEQQQWPQAASELERIATTTQDPQVARSALWQAAEMYEKGADKGADKGGNNGARASAARAYERYLKAYPQPLEPALEARHRLARIAKAEGNVTRETALMKEIYDADRNGGSARTDRTRYLGAMGALAMAAPSFEAYRKVTLVEPLQKQLKLKKARMEDVLKAYAVATDYGVADVITAATYQTAALYADFGRALMTSQRPKKLSKAELEQYNVMLEEQAFPFEEKAIELHEVNVRRTASGIYDPWVKNSYAALRELRPVRYGKSERGEGVIDAIR